MASSWYSTNPLKPEARWRRSEVAFHARRDESGSDSRDSTLAIAHFAVGCRGPQQVSRNQAKTLAANPQRYRDDQTIELRSMIFKSLKAKRPLHVAEPSRSASALG